MNYFAHSRAGQEQSAWELLEDHLQRTAVGFDNLPGSADFADAFHAREWGELVGRWHDLGKYSDAFQEYLRAATDSTDRNPQADPTVDHSTAGAQHAVTRCDPHVGRILAYCIAGHHAGLADWIDGASESALARRLKKCIEPWEANAPAALLDAVELSVPPQFRDLGQSIHGAFTLSVFTRMLFSCLVDADYLATELFLSRSRAALRNSEHVPTITEMRLAYEGYMASLVDREPERPINRIRGRILDASLAGATLEPGLFTLTVPTGGGKTLASLGFALNHIQAHAPSGPRRIIYTIPFTSIIEQTADQFRRVFADLGDQTVLEHHSNFQPAAECGSTLDLDANMNDWSRLASENWDVPLVVTTNVQFYESLFASRTSRCRKLHNIVRSVIILDEVQTLPVDLLRPCLAVLDELVRHYGCTIVLCSATQPAITRREDFQIGLPDVSELMPEPAQLQRELKRTSVMYLGSDALPDDALVESLHTCPQVLCIVNTRRHASALYSALEGMESSATNHHLSTWMCAAHRTESLNAIHHKLAAGSPCRVISTQLIEAGVDIDFPVVYRAMTGFDSIAQAAGRCNREGRAERGEVFVFEPECAIPPGMLTHTADCARELIRDFDDLLSLEAMEAYFKLLYWRKQDRMDARKILDQFMAGADGLVFNFRTVAERFRFIDDATRPVVIPWGDTGKQICARLSGAYPPSRHDVRRAQRYTVNVRERDWHALIGSGDVTLHHERYGVLENMRESLFLIFKQLQVGLDLAITEVRFNFHLDQGMNRVGCDSDVRDTPRGPVLCVDKRVAPGSRVGGTFDADQAMKQSSSMIRNFADQVAQHVHEGFGREVLILVVRPAMQLQQQVVVVRGHQYDSSENETEYLVSTPNKHCNHSVNEHGGQYAAKYDDPG
jgi:CRISPR-associated endonuclease/helicase Cas3